MNFVLQNLKIMNRTITIVMLALMMIGVAFIYSAGVNAASSISETLWQKQVYFILASLLIYFVFMNLDYHFLVRYSLLVYLTGLLLLALVFLPEIGLKRYGAQRWINLGFIQIQPSEFMKVAVVLFLAFLLERLNLCHMESTIFLKLLLVGIVVCLPFIMILKQPDLGSALVFMPLFLVMIWVAGAPVRIIVSIILIFLIGAALFISAVLLPPKMGITEEQHNAFLKKIGISEYQKKRIMVFFVSYHDPLGAGWNKAQSQIAVGSGRMWGKGYLQGTQNMLGYLPKTVAPNDFIFSVIAEEKGFVGAAVIILLFSTLIFSCTKTAIAAQDMAGALLAAGVATLIFIHSFINIGMTIGVLPITGIPLPLISYGGTFLFGMAAALGIVQNIYIQSKRKDFLSEKRNPEIFYTRKELLK